MSSHGKFSGVARWENVLRFPLGRNGDKPLFLHLGRIRSGGTRDDRAMPRPLKEDPRDVFKTFRFTHAEVTRLENRARASGRNLSSYVRMLLLERPGDVPEAELMVRPASPATLYQSGVAVLVEQIRKVGVNLNQIAARMNER